MKSFRSRRKNLFLHCGVNGNFVKLALRQCIVDNAETEYHEKQVCNGCTVTRYAGVGFDDVYLFAALVSMVILIYSACYEGQKDHRAAGSVTVATGSRVEVVGKADHPVDSVNTAGDNAEKNCETDGTTNNGTDKGGGTVLRSTVRSVLVCTLTVALISVGLTIPGGGILSAVTRVLLRVAVLILLLSAYLITAGGAEFCAVGGRAPAVSLWYPTVKVLSACGHTRLAGAEPRTHADSLT